jgi:hypothetical protein
MIPKRYRIGSEQGIMVLATAVIDLLDSLLGDEEDAMEHQKFWDFLKTALDEDRLSDRLI